MAGTTTGRYRATLAQLGTAQKSGRGAPLYVRFVNRRLGRWFAAWAYLRGLTPNQVSVISNVFTFAGLALIATVRPTWPEVIGVVALLLVGYAIDSADGQVARLRGGGSPAGEWLDHTADAIKMTAVHLMVAICWFRWFDLGHAAWLLVPLGYVLIASVFFFGVVATEMLRRIVARTPSALHRGEAGGASGGAAADGAAAAAQPAPVLRSVLVLPSDYGVLALSFLLLPAHRPFQVVYVALFVVNTMFLCVALTNWFREMRTLSW